MDFMTPKKLNKLKNLSIDHKTLISFSSLRTKTKPQTSFFFLRQQKQADRLVSRRPNRRPTHYITNPKLSEYH